MAKVVDPLFDPFSPAFRADPYPVFERLRREAPIYWSPILKAYVLTRHRDIARVLADPSFLPSPLRQNTATLMARAGRSLPAVDRLIEAAVIFDTTPGHRAARRMMAAALNTRPLSEYAPAIAAIADEIIGGLEGRPTFDAITEFADPLPVRVIHHVLGIPPELFETMGRLTAGLPAMFNYLNAVRDLIAWEGQVREAFDVLGDAVRERRARPREDGLSRMVQIGAQDGIEDEQLAARVMFLVMVGSETTAATLGNAIRHAIDVPEAAAAARDAAAMPAVSEELIRLEGTSLFAARYATRDSIVGEVAMPAGTGVYPYMAAANRDPEAYAEPDRFIPGRGGPPHMSFGDGIHACIGASLARLESRIAINAFFTRLQPLRRAGPDRWAPFDAFRHMASLPVAVG
ncbi:MAG: cytochrome P450 [Alphaproteobacteria bacterium]